jgi:D-glycero-D-manno-heptose 1,7-bisphosphate phosphatase
VYHSRKRPRQHNRRTLEKAIFLDKDGTLIPDIPYNADPELVSLSPYAGEALQSLQAAGFKLIVISNQSGVAKGYFNLEALRSINQRINFLLEPFDVVIDDFFYCPHFVSGSISEFAYDCDCRKPKPGLILDAANQLDINLSISWMIGDILNDCEAGNRAGCHTILLDNGHETEWLVTEIRQPDYTVQNLLEAASIIHSFETGNNAYESGRMVKE